MMNKSVSIFGKSLDKKTGFVLLLLVVQYPYVFPAIFGLPGLNIINVVFVVVLLLTKPTKSLVFPKPVVFCMITQVVLWFFYWLIHNDTSYFVRIFFIIETYIVVNYLIRSGSVFRFNLLNNNFILLQAILGAIGFILIAVGILPVIFEFTLEDGRPSYCYLITCSNAVMDNIVRICGYFDEPGALAFWGIFALLTNRLFFKKRIFEVILIISLLTTLSVAYFVILPFYFLLLTAKSFKKSLWILLTMLIVGFAMFNYLGDNEAFRYMTTERFEGGEIRSARQSYADNAEKIYKQNVLFGIGGRKFQDSFDSVSDNPYEVLAKDGTIGLIVTYFPLFICLLFFLKEKEVLFSIVILGLNYLQRPFHINEMHYFIMYLFVTMLFLKYKKGVSLDNNRINDRFLFQKIEKS